MEDIFEKKLKEFLPYIIIIGAVYLVVPALLLIFRNQLINQIVYMGVFPLTAFLCSAHYARKKYDDFFLSLVAPVLYLPSMLLYGNLKDSVWNSLIFLLAYFICGYIGLTVGVMLKPKSEKNADNFDEGTQSKKTGRARRVSVDSDDSRVYVPKKVDVSLYDDTQDEEEIVMPQSFEEAQNDTDSVLSDFSSAADDTDDIDSLIAEIHSLHDEEF